MKGKNNLALFNKNELQDIKAILSLLVSYRILLLDGYFNKCILC